MIGPRNAEERVMARAGRSFWLASRLLGRADAAGIAALYAFCRRADDIADGAESPTVAREHLLAAADAVAARDIRWPGLPALLRDEQARRLRLDPLERLLRALAADCGPRRVADERELLGYAYGVAGTVGELAAMRLRAVDPRARAHAIDLGVAMQLTNIARDVVEDALRDRIYLPATWLADADEVFAFARSPDPEIARRLWPTLERLLALADRHYASAAEGYRFLPTRARVAVVTAAAMYRSIGTQLRRLGPERWTGARVVASGWQRGRAAALGLRAAIHFDTPHPTPSTLSETRWHGLADP